MDKIMACSRYELGFDDDRFEIVVSQRFHCPICLLVLKDPVMCKNEHYYCSSCIMKYLKNSANCPSCLEYLSVETLKPASRIVMNYISELNIRCDFHSRGCPEMVQVGELKRHVESCGFAPVQCSNDGCNVIMNARDKLHHEAKVCDFRRLKCHDCGQIKNEVSEMKDQMLVGQNQMKIEMKVMMENEIKEMKNEVFVRQDQIRNEVKEIVENEMEAMKNELTEIVMTAMRDAMAGMEYLKVEMQESRESLQGACFSDTRENIFLERKEKVNTKKDSRHSLQEACSSDARETIFLGKKEKDNEIKEEMKDLKVQMADSKQSLQGACSSDTRENIFLVGGGRYRVEKWIKNTSTECFNWADQTWRFLNSAKFEGRTYACSFLYQGQMVVAGGFDDSGNLINTLRCLNIDDPAATWKHFAVILPIKCHGYKIVNLGDCLYMSGGRVKTIGRNKFKHFDVVCEVQLVPPYSSKILTRLPQTRCYHGMEMFDQKLFILGGQDDRMITASVIHYDLIRNECKEMSPLPFAVQEMATVLWRNNVLVIGGTDARCRSLNKVVMYDVITGRSEMLPNMKQKRYGCTAVLTGNVVVVMGGRNKKYKYLKSVESFDLERRVWEDLPDMIEPRAFATAIVKPNH